MTAAMRQKEREEKRKKMKEKSAERRKKEKLKKGNLRRNKLQSANVPLDVCPVKIQISLCIRTV